MIEIAGGETRAWLSPERGGMATRLVVGEREVLYLDEASFADATKNVRGGVPVLFPSPGPLSAGRFAMKQHGFARDRRWRVVATDASSATLALESDEATLADYPFRFALAYRYSIVGGALRVDQTIENRGAEPMPYAAGFHPYFAVNDADKARASIPTAARRAWDNVEKREIDLTGPIDLRAKEVDLHLVDHGASEASLALPGARVVVRASPAYRRWVVWTLRGKDFVCLEPWTAPANALNTGDGLRHVAPGAKDELFVEIALA